MKEKVNTICYQMRTFDNNLEVTAMLNGRRYAGISWRIELDRNGSSYWTGKSTWCNLGTLNDLAAPTEPEKHYWSPEKLSTMAMALESFRTLIDDGPHYFVTELRHRATAWNEALRKHEASK